MERERVERYGGRVRGCLLGGAIGDALGAPVEFWSLDEVRRVVGDAGVREYLPYEGGHGLVTDDTQMTLFTVDGLIRASIRSDRGIGFTIAVVHAAYDRWLDTQQGGTGAGGGGWLMGERWLHARRAPGMTCLDALNAARRGGDRIPQYGGLAANDSKGCGGVMRSAPFGLLPPFAPGGEGPGWWTPERAFAAAAEAAGYTHGHVTGRLASGALAAAVAAIVGGQGLDEALDAGTAILLGHEGHDETSAALAAARWAATDRRAAGAGAAVEVPAELGEGWVAEEALAIAVFAAVAHPGPDEVLDALALAVTHGGDSDSTGAICGNLLGALHGDTALPATLVFEVEGRGTILQLADDLVLEFTRGRELHGDHGPRTRWAGRY